MNLRLLGMTVLSLLAILGLASCVTPPKLSDPDPVRSPEALINAITSNDLQRVKELLDQGWHPELGVSSVGSPMLAAAFVGNAEIIRDLAKHGASVDDENVRYSCGAADTPLFMATSLGHKEAVKELLRCGADINGCGASLGRRPIVGVLNCNDMEILKLLLKAKPTRTSIVYVARKCYERSFGNEQSFELFREMIKFLNGGRLPRTKWTNQWLEQVIQCDCIALHDVSDISRSDPNAVPQPVDSPEQPEEK